ncbi:MAG: methyltransferase domain-containing protein [Butyrivibrio sp.]|nr:methyltransferase domain-containing protein [Butyrivibrio sp.]
MEAYTDFAAVYDTFMDETPYEVWGDFVVGLIEKYGVSRPSHVDGKQEAEENSEKALEQEKNLVVELGCGTGSFSQVLRRRGYDIIGIDMSPEMLDLARKKSVEAGMDIMYIEQDMRELDLYCTAGTIVSVCDSINYILTDEEIVEIFRLVNNFLYPGGVFIFDFNTLHKYRDVIGDATIAENRDDCSFIWENYFHEDGHINEYDLTIFARTGKETDTFRRSMETHYQRGFEIDEMIGFVKEAGLEFIASIDADTYEEPDENSERIYIVAGEKGK